MEPLKNALNDADAENDAVAVRRPLRAEHVARRIAVNDLRRLAAHVRHGNAGAFGVFGGTDEREAVTGRTERRTAVCERQLVLRMSTPGSDPGFPLERHALVKDHLRAIRRPRRRSNLARRTALAVRIVDAPLVSVPADVGKDITAQDRRIELDAAGPPAARTSAGVDVHRDDPRVFRVLRHRAAIVERLLRRHAIRHNGRLSAVHFGLPQKPPCGVRCFRPDPSGWTM